MTLHTADVVILGGGLAGLTLALQLKRQDSNIQVSVIERRTHPVPEGAFKVGESTVEIGAHYLADLLDLRTHLDQQHIGKFGFRFFFSEGRQDIDRCTELGVSQLLHTPSWQIDRGRFENFLGHHVRGLGVHFLDGATVRGVDLDDGDGLHTVRIEQAGEAAVLQARWVIDASGRAGLLKRKLDLAVPNTHNINAVWWRVEGLVDPNNWSQDPAWRARCTPADRWRSTNHMCGPGYWFWLIPLACGAHSLGIVCDADLHPLDTMNTHAKAMDWLRQHQPQVAASLDDGAHALLDFAFLRNVSYGCKQVFGDRRWAITGEAGLFLDPFYSPGTDFIAISNGYIAELIARDRAGKDHAPYASIYNQLYQSFYENTLSLYQGQYPLFGDKQVMPVKVIWDYTYYWALLAPLFFAGRLTDVPLLGRLRPLFQRGRALNLAIQALLADWGAHNARLPRPDLADDRLLDQYAIDWFGELNRALNDELDTDALTARLQSNVARMEWLAAEILDRASHCHPALADQGLPQLLAGVGEHPASLGPQWYAIAS